MLFAPPAISLLQVSAKHRTRGGRLFYFLRQKYLPKQPLSCTTRVYIEVRRRIDIRVYTQCTASNKEIPGRLSIPDSKIGMPSLCLCTTPGQQQPATVFRRLHSKTPFRCGLRTAPSRPSQTYVPARVRGVHTRFQSIFSNSIISSCVEEYRALPASLRLLSWCSSLTLMIRLYSARFSAARSSCSSSSFERANSRNAPGDC